MIQMTQQFDNTNAAIDSMGAPSVVAMLRG